MRSCGLFYFDTQPGGRCFFVKSVTIPKQELLSPEMFISGRGNAHHPVLRFRLHSLRFGCLDDGAGHAGAPRRPDPDLKAWLAPFVMGPVNTRVVRRSAALLDYGADFHCQEYLRVGPDALTGLAATSVSGGMQASRVAMGFAGVRALAARFAPKPGKGPAEATMDGARFDVNCWPEVPAAMCCADVYPTAAIRATAPPPRWSARRHWRWCVSATGCRARAAC